ncbi:hypothetical protein [Terrisporobacter petrolearius]|uniref:hypothetical protein n=1 Tax=Terrisporobacter petrolearius TaxID=1460447 RepID=UPI003EBB3178
MEHEGTTVYNSNSVRSEVVDEVVMKKLIEAVNNELLLKKVINNVNKNKSSKLKSKLDEISKVNKEIEGLKFRVD